MLVIGIDPGTATTGYGLVRENQDGSLSAVDFGAIVTSADLPMPLRLLELYKKLKEVLLLHHPESGAVEKLFFQRNVTYCHQCGPGTWSCFTGSGGKWDRCRWNTHRWR